MEPRIQYAQTKDGVSIAFATLGEGMPLILPALGGVCEIQVTSEFPRLRSWLEQMAQGRQLVWYDGRGTGLSQRDVGDQSLDAMLMDLDAVVDRLGLQRFALIGRYFTGAVAVSYAARHRDRVSHLVLWSAYAQASDWTRFPQAQALLKVLDTDWEMYTETMAHAAMAWSAGEAAHRYAALIREGVTEATYKAHMNALLTFDVTDVLSQIAAPTLVLQPRASVMPHMDVAVNLASRIPNARLAVLEGTSAARTWATPRVAATIDEFLSEGEEAEAKAELPEGMAVLLFADIAESTALTEQLGDAAFRSKARELDTSMRSVINESGGTPVEGKVLGDGVLAVFTSARQAIDCALRCEVAGEPLDLQLHLGIHAGDVIREGNNVYGGAVNIAARIAAASEPGEVLVSDTLRGLARTSAGVTFDDRGEHTLKGVGEPQRLFAVRGGG